MPSLDYFAGIATGITLVFVCLFVGEWARRYRQRKWREGMARQFGKKG